MDGCLIWLRKMKKTFKDRLIVLWMERPGLVFTHNQVALI